ncbi:MAG TPA: hypothetical protein VFA52_03350 [Candidatus Paceibacterota bacterium]|nr:hypothetical protein [Candidatus Paceibacterota bacterium]
MKKVFIVEDYKNILKGWGLIWEADGYDLEVIPAFTLEEANSLLDQGIDFDLAVIDGHVGKNQPYNSGGLIRRIRATYSVPILATSSEVKTREQMQKDGCSEVVDKMVNMAVVNKVVEILGLKPSQPFPV